MDAAELKNLVSTCVAHWEAPEGSPASASTQWATAALLDLRLKGPHEELWEFIQAACARPMSDEAFAVLAAGPMEDLLSAAGTSFIDRVEQLAASDERFNHLLGGVWPSDIDPVVWARIERARRASW